MTLLELFQLIKKHLRLVIVLPIVCLLGMTAFAWLVMPNTYTASVSMYVLTRADSAEEALSNADLSASQMLTNDVASLIKSDRVFNDTQNALQLNNLADYKIEVASATTTRVINLSVTGESAQSVAVIANKLAETTDAVAQEAMEIGSVNVIDQATEPQSASGPPRAMYAAVAFLVGIFLAIAIIVFMDMINTKVRTPEEIEELLGIPVIGRIPKTNG